MNWRFKILKKMDPGVCLPLPRGINHAYDHNVQRSSLKTLGQSKSNFIESICI